MNVFPFKKMFFDIYGTHDYMTFLISACSKDDDEMKALAKLNKKYTDERNESGMIDLLIKIGLLFEKMKGTIDDYLNAIFAYSFAMEKCFLDKYTKIKIELTIKCAKIYVIMGKKEKKRETAEQNGEIYQETDETNDDLDNGYDNYNISTEAENHVIYECEYLTSAILMFNIAVDTIERTQQNTEKLINIFWEIVKIQKKQNKYKDAISTLNKCLRISVNTKTIKHEDSLLIISEMAHIHRLILELGQAFKYYTMVFKIQNEEPITYIQTLKLLKTMISLGHVSFFQGNSIDALYYYKTALKKSEEIIEPSNKVIEDLLTCISTVYIYSNHPEKALKYKQILIERGLDTKIIEATYIKNNIIQKSCACCFEIKEKLFLCSGCHKVHYCNREHQIKDWSYHKLFCLNESSSKIKLESLKPKFMALTQTAHPNEIFGTLFYIKNRSLYKRASNGEFYSMVEIGRMSHDNGYFNESLKWFCKMAVRENTGAEYYVGLAYLYGKGTNKNIVEAIKWLSLAANKYHAEAQYELGVLYYNINNTSQGVGWVRLAAVQKHKRAIQMLENLGVPLL